jgi:hypothetical protein
MDLAVRFGALHCNGDPILKHAKVNLCRNPNIHFAPKHRRPVLYSGKIGFNSFG